MNRKRGSVDGYDHHDAAHHHGMARDDDSSQSQKYCCIAIGVLVGVFIQFSSLCSNAYDFFLFVSLQQQQQAEEQELDTTNTDTTTTLLIPLTHPQHNNGGAWKFAWSIGTTTFGIVLLLTLRTLVVVSMNSYSTNSSTYNNNSTDDCDDDDDDDDSEDGGDNCHVESKIQQQQPQCSHRNSTTTTTTGTSTMERCVATGTLWGVSIAWIMTDYLLGYSIPSSSSSSSSSSKQQQSVPSPTDAIIANTYHNVSSYWYVPILLSGTALLAWHWVVGFGRHNMNDKDDERHDDDQSTWDVDDDMDHTTAFSTLRKPLLITECNNNGTPTIRRQQPVLRPDDVANQRIRKSDNPRVVIVAVRFVSCLVGLMIGVFIQSSTLGVTYIGQFVLYNRATIQQLVVQQLLLLEVRTIDSDNDNGGDDDGISEAIAAESTRSSAGITVVANNFDGMTIGISFIISGIGFILLLFIRALIIYLIQQQQHNDTNTNGSDASMQTTTDNQCKGSKMNETSTKSIDQTVLTTTTTTTTKTTIWDDYSPLQRHVLLNIESFLATGAVVGLNVAWMVTDYLLFSIPHQPQSSSSIDSNDEDGYTYWFQSFVTFVISTSWCPFILYCTGFFSSHPNRSSSSGGSHRRRRNETNHGKQSVSTTIQLIPSNEEMSNSCSNSDNTCLLLLSTNDTTSIFPSTLENNSTSTGRRGSCTTTAESHRCNYRTACDVHIDDDEEMAFM